MASAAGAPGAVAVGVIDTIYCTAAVTLGAVAAPAISRWGRWPAVAGGIALLAIAGSRPVALALPPRCHRLDRAAVGNRMAPLRAVPRTDGHQPGHPGVLRGHHGRPCPPAAVPAGRRTLRRRGGTASISWQLVVVAVGALMRGRLTPRRPPGHGGGRQPDRRRPRCGHADQRRLTSAPISRIPGARRLQHTGRRGRGQSMSPPGPRRLCATSPASQPFWSAATRCRHAAGRPPATPALPSPIPTPIATITHGGQATEPFRPPPFRVLYASTELLLEPFTYCAVHTGSVGARTASTTTRHPSVRPPGSSSSFR